MNEPADTGPPLRPTIAIHRVVVGVLETNCWLIHADGRADALIVDPGDDAESILATVSRLGPVVRAIVLTHAHFDHVRAVPGLVAGLDVPVLAHPDDATVWPGELAQARQRGHWDAGTATADLLRERPADLRPDPTIPMWDGVTTAVVDGEQVNVAGLRVLALHTPRSHAGLPHPGGRPGRYRQIRGHAPVHRGHALPRRAGADRPAVGRVRLRIDHVECQPPHVLARCHPRSPRRWPGHDHRHRAQQRAALASPRMVGPQPPSPDESPRGHGAGDRMRSPVS